MTGGVEGSKIEPPKFEFTRLSDGKVTSSHSSCLGSVPKELGKPSEKRPSSVADTLPPGAKRLSLPELALATLLKFTSGAGVSEQQSHEYEPLYPGDEGQVYEKDTPQSPR